MLDNRWLLQITELNKESELSLTGGEALTHGEGSIVQGLENWLQERVIIIQPCKLMMGKADLMNVSIQATRVPKQHFVPGRRDYPKGYARFHLVEGNIPDKYLSCPKGSGLYLSLLGQQLGFRHQSAKKPRRPGDRGQTLN